MELEEVKSHYRNKITELEAATKKQERKSNCINYRFSMVLAYNWSDLWISPWLAKEQITFFSV